MRSIGRAAALIAVVGMPGAAYALALVTVSMWEGLDSTSLADAGVALESGLALLAAAVGATIAAYLALTGYAMLVGAAWRGGRAIPRALAALAPQGWTKVTAMALGLSMSAGLAAPALAADPGSTPGQSAGWVAAPVSVVVEPAPLAVAVEPAALSVGWIEADAMAAPAGSQQNGVQEASTLHDVPPLDNSSLESAPLDSAPPQAAQSEAAPPEDSPPESAPPQAAPAKTTPPQTAPQPSSVHIVQSGESLWRITEALLGADATTAQVAAAWPELYVANCESIGDNPSLIQPGLALTIPAGLGA